MPNQNYTPSMSATPQNPRPVYTPGQYASQPNRNPSTGSNPLRPDTGNTEEEMRKQQLMLRRRIDNKIRYGQPVSDQEMAEARRIGAV
jgi:hypothetical protein